jgi:hypothetical protein
LTRGLIPALRALRRRIEPLHLQEDGLGLGALCVYRVGLCARHRGPDEARQEQAD